MPLPPPVVAALEAAVDAAPGNVLLRVRLAGVLLDAGRAADAARHCADVLAVAPASVDALALAERAATLLADDVAAARLRSRRLALGDRSDDDDRAPDDGVRRRRRRPGFGAP